MRDVHHSLKRERCKISIIIYERESCLVSIIVYDCEDA